MGESFVEQPDGRMVAGGPVHIDSLNLGKPKTASSGLGVKAAIGVALALAAGVFLGRTTVSPESVTWQETAIQRAIEGCLPVFLVESVAKPEQVDQLTTILNTRAAAIKAQYTDATNIQTRVLPVPPNGIIARKYPGVAHIGIITLERCLGGP